MFAHIYRVSQSLNSINKSARKEIKYWKKSPKTPTKNKEQPKCCEQNICWKAESGNT